MKFLFIKSLNGKRQNYILPLYKKAVLILFCIPLYSCNDNYEQQDITPVLISKGVTFNGNYNPTQHAEIFYNQTTWENFKNDIWQLSEFPDESNVDFNNDIVIAAFDLPRTTGGYEVTITSITENYETIIVHILYTGNGDATQMPTRPYHFVKIPKTTKPIIFQ